MPFTLIATSQEESESSPQPRTATDADVSAITSTNSEMPFVFRTPDSLPERPQSIRSPSVDTSWIGKLFSSNEPNRTQERESDSNLDEVTQIASQELPILSPYHAQLIQILARSKYHDKQYEFASLTIPRRLVLKLKLHASGALLRVNVETSSGDEALDAAAQRSAYAASPFPPPPASDEQHGYSYPVEIKYQPRFGN